MPLESRWGRRDLRGGDDGRRGGSYVADALGHGHDVRNHSLGLEAPEVGAGPAEAGLHFVGDAEPAGGPHMRVGLGQVAVGEDDEAAQALNRLGDEAGDFAGGGVFDQAA